MNGNKLSTRDYQIFLYISFFGLSLAWGGFALALSGFFYAWIAWASAGIFGILLLKLSHKHRVILKMSKEMLIANLIFASIALIFSYLTTPTVFTGRDQGAISEAAIRLSQNHSFYFSTPVSEEFFKLHEKGRALNFPGFYYTQEGSLVTQFPLGYITWLALFFWAFSIKGFMLANAVLLYFFLTSFYLTTRLFLNFAPALPTMLFTVSSFIFMWFSKFTLSENMALPLLWLSILSLILFIQGQRRLYFFVLILSLFLLCFTRIEGFAFLAVSLVVVLANQETRKYVREQLFCRFFLPLGFFIITFAINAKIDINFYKEMVKALFPSVKLPQAQYLGNLKNAALPEYYNLKLFFLYGLLGFFLLGGIAIVIYLFKKEWHKLIPFAVVLPTFIYLIDSNISSDHPWMLRRFMFSIVPLAIFYTGIFLGELLEKKRNEKNSYSLKILAITISFILIAYNLRAFSYFINFEENAGLLEQTEKLSQRFSDKDLILVDQKVTANGWAMIAGPMNSLYGKNSVYFFNIQDLHGLNLSKFENVYLISPDKQVAYYTNSTLGKKLEEHGEYKLQFPKLSMEKDDPLKPVDFPEKTIAEVEGKIFKVSK